MENWSSGYVSEVGYTYGYYSELNPLKMQLALLNSGIKAPVVGTACELGFGQGLSTNFHAIGGLSDWYGTDFNPSQAGFAQYLGADCEYGPKLFDQSFEEFCTRPDLPDFDFIAMHGIWSWVSEENRKIIIEFVRRKLKVGGVLYISYNTMPGWANFAPMRHLLKRHTSQFGGDAVGLGSRIDTAFQFTGELFGIDSQFTKSAEGIVKRFENFKKQDKSYLAHEFFNKDWEPQYFSEVANSLEQSKLSFACSAHYIDTVNSINFTDSQLSFLQKIEDTHFREEIKDFITNQQFRRDYWVKGPRKLSGLERYEALRKQKVILCFGKNHIPKSVQGMLGKADLQSSIYGPILDCLGDHDVKSLGDIENSLRTSGLGFDAILQAVIVLIGLGAVAPALIGTRNSKGVQRINQRLMKLARTSNTIQQLVSPITGGPVGVARFNQLFLLARIGGKKSVDDWAQFVWKVLAAQGQKILKDGKTLETADDNLKELRQQAVDFETNVLPVLRALGIAK